MNAITTALVALAVVCFVLYRQTRPRPIGDDLLKLPIVLGAIGVVQILEYLGHGGAPSVGEVCAAVLGLAVALALAYPRAASLRVYRTPDGTLMRRGTAATVALWLIAIGAHIAIDAVVPLAFGDHGRGGLAGVTLMLYLAIALGAQAVFLRRRVAAHQQPAAPVQVR
ncbi:hypothetical protein P0W64_01090 [Tsukamurella sp. 8F]|uniref:hypothetical protein n=1 Tax=unclassified Tsukamurella TaxID=2633480 RepID=UPI0023BA33C7|nr:MULTISPECIES: hypothetical protein [unclassified Tsukamurella]MDF0529181.1 hypothetical protein [Tsukamurella sp. 8J]MDF0585366.1 hypothetical protein [Tsukamurella sp. 8F]